MAAGDQVGGGIAHGMVAGADGMPAGVVGMVAVGAGGTIRGTPDGTVPDGAGVAGTAVVSLLAVMQIMDQGELPTWTLITGET